MKLRLFIEVWPYEVHDVGDEGKVFNQVELLDVHVEVGIVVLLTSKDADLFHDTIHPHCKYFGGG